MITSKRKKRKLGIISVNGAVFSLVFSHGRTKSYAMAVISGGSINVTRVSNAGWRSGTHDKCADRRLNTDIFLILTASLVTMLKDYCTNKSHFISKDCEQSERTPSRFISNVA